jgi:hypothetical protein
MTPWENFLNTIGLWQVMEEAQNNGARAHIRCKTIIEVLGKPKEYTEQALSKYIDHIKKDDELVILNQDLSEISERDKLFSKFVELDLVVKGTSKLISFCFEYMPSSVEVIKPESLKLMNNEITGFLNDLQAKLHGVDMAIKQLKSENDFLRANMNAILNNTILICLKVGKFPVDKLAKLTGVNEKELQIYLDNLIKENRIKKEGDNFLLA